MFLGYCRQYFVIPSTTTNTIKVRLLLSTTHIVAHSAAWRTAQWYSFSSSIYLQIKQEEPSNSSGVKHEALISVWRGSFALVLQPLRVSLTGKYLHLGRLLFPLHSSDASWSTESARGMFKSTNVPTTVVLFVQKGICIKKDNAQMRQD